MRWIAVALLMFLSACASLPQQAPPDKHPPTLSPILPAEQWRFSGRFGASSADDSWSGGLRWEQQGSHYRILLSGPLGGSIQLRGGEGFSELRVSAEEIYTNADAESLLLEHTGWRFPFNGLRYWLMGQPAPEFVPRNIQRDQQGRLLKMRQAGWDIDFRRYVQVGRVQLPEKIFLEHRQFDVRLVVDEWEMPG